MPPSTKLVRAWITSAGAVCSAGVGIRQTSAAIRAGLGRIAETPLRDRFLEPVRMALLAAEALEPLRAELEVTVREGPVRRLLRLAAPALREAAAGAGQTGALPVLMGVNGSAKELDRLTAGGLLGALATQAGVPLRLDASRLVGGGRAAALLALRAAMEDLTRGTVDAVLVGGADTHLDPVRLGALDQEGRLLGPQAPDGFIPGEGAAFVLVSRRADRTASGAVPLQVVACGRGTETGHRYSSEPARGEGLSAAIADLLVSFPPPHPPVRTVLASLNGESALAKPWGVACLRHRDLLPADLRLEHPADCLGDLGAATGALLLALAFETLTAETRDAPALVWAASDREEVACCYLDHAH
jgi:3-oxoacyl-[acyl-carrier-protein] synthase-1